MKTHPFHDGLWDMVSEKWNASNIPCFLAASQIFMIHGRGAYEAWRTRNPENTFLQLVDCDYYSWPSREASNKIIQFLDHYLKEKDAPAPEKVGIQVRLGNGEWYWRKEKTWPVPGIQYTKWHLTTGGTLSTNEDHGPATKFEYSTKIPDNGKSGVSFHSPPFDEDVEFAGHFSAILNISSSASDADFVVMLWPVDEDGKVVPFGGSSGKKEPLAKGFLRASHRKLNPEKTLPERPWHTHVEQDNLPLTPGDVVKIEVELYPAAGRIRKSWRLRLDITPSEHQPDIPGYKAPEMRTTWGEMHGEASNTIHVGDSLANFVLCPVVPLQQGYPNLVL
jgi:predicted acyl esterase